MTDLRTAIILVAGTGSRLKPLTAEVPKALVSLGRETILQRLVRQLSVCGIDHLVLATGYCESMIRSAFKSSNLTIDYCYNPGYAQSQNSISLGICADAVAGESFVKLDGDLVLDPEVVGAVINDPSTMTVAVDTSRQLDDEAMKVRMRPDGTIITFAKSIPLHLAQAESVGIEKLSADIAEIVFARIGELRRAGILDRYYEETYAELISESKLTAHAVDVASLAWTEVDTFEDLNQARQLIHVADASS